MRLGTEGTKFRAVNFRPNGTGKFICRRMMEHHVAVQPNHPGWATRYQAIVRRVLRSHRADGEEGFFADGAAVSGDSENGAVVDGCLRHA